MMYYLGNVSGVVGSVGTSEGRAGVERQWP